MLVCVRWYVAYPLSLRNLEEMMAERGISVDHSTVHRWAIKLLPVVEKAFRRCKRPVGKSWRVDETYIKVKGQWKYLYPYSSVRCQLSAENWSSSRRSEACNARRILWPTRAAGGPRGLEAQGFAARRVLRQNQARRPAFAADLNSKHPHTIWQSASNLSPSRCRPVARPNRSRRLSFNSSRRAGRG